MLGILGVASNETPGAKAEAPLDSDRPPPAPAHLTPWVPSGSWEVTTEAGVQPVVRGTLGFAASRSQDLWILKGLKF